MADAPTTAYTEVQIDNDSITLTLISESGSNGVVVEDTERFTFEELEEMQGEHLTLSLSDGSREALAEREESAMRAQVAGLTEPTGQDSDNSVDVATGQTEVTYKVPEVGDVVRDGRPPDWSKDNRLKVVSISDKSADEYVVGESLFETKTVADANPSCDDGETVIEAQYLDDWGNPTGKVYGFPVSRLEDI